MSAEDSKNDQENVAPNVPLKSLVFKIEATCQLTKGLHHLEINEQLILSDNVNEATKYYSRQKDFLEKQSGQFEVSDKSPGYELLHETCILVANDENMIQSTQYSVITMKTSKVCLHLILSLYHNHTDYFVYV